MFRLRNIPIYASEIAELLNLKLVGSDFLISGPSTLGTLVNGKFIFLSKVESVTKDFLSKYSDILMIVSEPLPDCPEGFAYILSLHPKIDFIKAINEFFIEVEIAKIEVSAKIASSAKLGKNISIGHNSVIGPDVIIGNNTIILNNVVINGRVEIGANCIIKDNTTIGRQSFDFVLNEERTPIQYPHVGRILIGNNVWVGANTAIESGGVDDTIIRDFVKIDDLVQIGCDSEIKERTLITAGAIISRNVTIGQDCMIGLNVSVRDEIAICDDVTIGIGAVVVKTLTKSGIYFGNPAVFYEKSKRG